MHDRFARAVAVVLVIACHQGAFAGDLASIQTMIVAGPIEHCTLTQSPCYATAFCPAGMYAISGGMRGDESKIQGVGGDDGSWSGQFRGAYSEFASTANADAQGFAICSTGPVATSYVTDQQLHCNSGSESCEVSLACPPGETVVEGGFFGTQVLIEASAAPADERWIVAWVKDSEELGSGALGLLIPHARCTSHAQLAVEHVFGEPIECHGPTASCASSVECPPGKIVIAGGFAGDESHVESMYPISNSAWAVSWYPARSAFGSTARGLGIAQAVCANGSPYVDPVFRDGFELPPFDADR